MKQLTLFAFLCTFLLATSGCRREGCMDSNACNYDSKATKDDGTCNYGCNGSGGGGGGTGGGGGGSSTGKVTFWNDQSWVGVITVYCGGASGSITSNTEPSSCGTSGCANFTAAPGSYSFSASATTGETWSGTANISSGGCLLFYLH